MRGGNEESLIDKDSGHAAISAEEAEDKVVPDGNAGEIAAAAGVHNIYFR